MPKAIMIRMTASANLDFIAHKETPKIQPATPRSRPAVQVEDAGKRAAEPPA